MSCTATHRIPESATADAAGWAKRAARVSPALGSKHSPEPRRWDSALDVDEVRSLYREIFEAQQVQRRLGGSRRLRRGQFEIATEIFPVQHFSGDFVCLFDQGDSTIVAFGDVAGKGLTAAMWSTHLMSLVRTYSASLRAPKAVVSAINRDLCSLGAGVPITTMVLAKLDWQRNELTYCNAGHFPPLINRANGDVQRLSVGGPALAAIPSAQFDEMRVQFAPSDMFVGYSDGLIECRNPNDEEFGVEKLLAQAKYSQNQTASRALFSIIAAAQDFALGTPRSDDLTLLIIAGVEVRV